MTASSSPEHFLGHSEEDGAAPVYQPGASAGNSEAAGYQPAAPVEQSANPRNEIGTTHMNAPTTSTAPSTPSSQCNPHETVEALAAEHGLAIEEWDASALDEPLRDKFFAMYVQTKDARYIVVPVGQDPAHRLAAVRALLAHPGTTA